MSQNQFLPVATGAGANTLTPAQWAVLGPLLAQGFQSGVALSIQVNTLFRQLSTVMSGLAQFTADNQAQDVLDDGVPANFEQKFRAALQGALSVSSVHYGVASGTGDTMVVTASPPIVPTPSGAYPAGTVLVVQTPNTANATPVPTINSNGIGAVSVLKANGSQVAASDIPALAGIILYSDGTNFRRLGLVPSDIRAIVGTLTRVLLTGNLTIYVRTDGNDANNGLANTAAGAFKTIAAAYTYLCQTYIFAGYTITIQLGIAGTYAGCDLPNLGVTGTVILRGDPTSNVTAQNYIVSALIDPYASRCITSSIQTVTTTGVMLDMSGAVNGFAAWVHAGGGLYLGNTTILRFAGNAPNVSLIGIDSGATLSTFGLVQVLGGGTFGNVFYIDGEFNGSLGITQPTTFVINSVVFTTFCSVSDGAAQFQYYTFSQSGNAGSKYYANLNGIINSYGLTLPGSTAGALATGGQYV